MLAFDRLVQKTAMTAEEIGRLRKAYELALREIGVMDRDDPLTEGVAKGIVEAQKVWSILLRTGVLAPNFLPQNSKNNF
jgi:hypothetical protein